MFQKCVQSGGTYKKQNQSFKGWFDKFENNTSKNVYKIHYDKDTFSRIKANVKDKIVKPKYNDLLYFY